MISNTLRVNLLMPYIGYTAYGRVYLKGRIINRRRLVEQRNPTLWRNLKNNFHRFSTYKYENILITLHFDDNVLKAKSDDQGYFVFDQPVNVKEANTPEWSTATVKIADSKIGEIETPVRILKVVSMDKRAIVCDIDDTIMESHVSSWMKLKMLFYSFTRSAIQRKPVDNMAALLNKLCLTEEGCRPIFYVSNSPWNIFDFICKFMTHFDFPEGPIFLRDYGWQLIRRKKTDPIHKLETIGKLFDTLSDFTFILIGDSSEKDIDHYLALSEQYPNRVECIFIRDVGVKSKRNRIKAKMDQQNSNIDFRLNADVQQFYLNTNKPMN